MAVEKACGDVDEVVEQISRLSFEGVDDGHDALDVTTAGGRLGSEAGLAVEHAMSVGALGALLVGSTSALVAKVK